MNTFLCTILGTLLAFNLTAAHLSDLSNWETAEQVPSSSAEELVLLEWEAGWTASDYDRDGSNAKVVFRVEQGQLRTECLEAPFDDEYIESVSFSVNQSGWSSSIYMIHSDRYNVEETDSNWTKGWNALWLIAPAPWDDDFVKENSPELREQVAQYLNFTLNGKPVSGVLWAMRGNGHIDLNFTFDQPVTLTEGYRLEVRLGMPE